jgi:hypothetical protein
MQGFTKQAHPSAAPVARVLGRTFPPLDLGDILLMKLAKMWMNLSIPGTPNFISITGIEPIGAGYTCVDHTGTTYHVETGRRGTVFAPYAA